MNNETVPVPTFTAPADAQQNFVQISTPNFTQVDNKCGKYRYKFIYALN